MIIADQNASLGRLNSVSKRETSKIKHPKEIARYPITNANIISKIAIHIPILSKVAK